MLLVGVDDTDSPEGGCTTSLAEPIVSLFPGLRLHGPPRLVRLNPNVPWKTRGNAAIALRFDGEEDLDAALARVMGFVETRAMRHDGTEPGVVVAREAPPASLYDAAVTRIVERSEVDAILAKMDARAAGGRGVIGASAALAWPAARATWERIAYRDAARVGTPRDVDGAWVREIEWGYPSTFDSYDLVNAEVVCVPSGPDPVLWGIRGLDPDALAKASAILGPERPARETLFLTNQASDDHLRDRSVSDCRERESARVSGRVASEPIDANGTILVEIADETGTLRAAAYPPTRAFRHRVRLLAPGDEVVLCGGIQRGPDGRLTLGIEKMDVRATRPRPAGPPTCPSCARSMRSAGTGAGFRCRDCGTRAEAPRSAEAALRLGWHEVPASARRHLARPLRLDGAGPPR